MIIRHDGFKVFPSFIEKAVLADSRVDACCAVGMADKAHSQGKLPIVYIVLKSGYIEKETEIEQNLVSLCKKELPEYAQPIAYRFRETLSLTPIGKIDYRALENEAES